MVGAENLPKVPSLLNPRGDGFNPELFDSPVEAERLVVQARAGLGPLGRPGVRREEEIRRGTASAVLVIPPDLP